MRVQYIEVSLDQVIQYYAKDFTPDQGRVLAREWYIDPFKDKVIFKLHIVEGGDEETSGRMEAGPD